MSDQADRTVLVIDLGEVTPTEAHRVLGELNSDALEAAYLVAGYRAQAVLIACGAPDG